MKPTVTKTEAGTRTGTAQQDMPSAEDRLAAIRQMAGAACDECAAAVAALAAVVERLGELLLDQGEELTDLRRQLGVHQEAVALARKVAGGEPPSYEQAVSVQARRRAMHAAPTAGGAR